ncbi:hypothetical protein HAHE_14730 [Haloferula helveola]|uniref:Uncharacterized protein n=1 Tax=Haloferula helveola TaxID=490095 RepID=A0ABN6H1V2_9BACT|nr:hypothetical protein HAHE_14730 [Haloferula helveola]
MLGAVCNCDLPEVERNVCELLNRVREMHGFHFSWLDFEDIRFLSGQPDLRAVITERAGIGGDRHAHWNDAERVLRGLASMGGLVLGGQAALDATHELPNVCRIMLCNCEECDEPELHGKVDRDFCGIEQLPTEVASRFLDWMTEHPYGVGAPCAAAEELRRMKESLRAQPQMA